MSDFFRSLRASLVLLLLLVLVPGAAMVSRSGPTLRSIAAPNAIHHSTSERRHMS